MEKVQNFIEFMKVVDNLKIEKRWEGLSHWNGIGKDNHPETVAAHSWKLSLLIISVINEYGIKDVSIERVVQLSVVHDLAESITGDISARFVYNGTCSSEKKETLESAAIEKLLLNVSGDTRSYISSLWNEYEDCETRDAKFVKALDKLEGLLHFINHAKLGEDLHMDETQGFGFWGNKYFVEFPELRILIDEVKLKMKKKFEENNVEWKAEYNICWK